jgi:hypothetical protein
MRPLLVLSLAAVAACGDISGLGRAGITNVVDSLVSLYALTGTPPSTPSGYSLDRAAVVRTSETSFFDFAFEIDSLGRAVLLPTGPLRLGRGSGIQLTDTEFDSIKVAPAGGYQLDSAVVVTAGDVAIVQSRPSSCIPGLVIHFYAKLQVLAIDSVARRLDFKILTDSNCGYRGLEPGLPTR